ncbi:MAG: alkaline phosphatase D family protein [Solirubrobacteraceae bacterium]
MRHRTTRTGLAAALGVAVLACPAVAAADPAAFAYGVTAGDVTTSSAIFWTRAQHAGTVGLRVSRTAGLATCSKAASRRGAKVTGVLRRALTARAGADFTVQSTISGLKPATKYFYRFCSGSTASRLGTITTAPPTSFKGPVRFGVTGDADGAIDPATGAPAYNHFEVYRRMVTENNAFNVNLGDVMYSDSAVAGVPPALTLPDKWGKYRLNLSYPNLRRLRSSAPLYSQWDDHEWIDNFNRPQYGEALFHAGARAFLNYNPAKYRPATGLYRHFRWGRNVDVFFLDERAFRSAPASLNPACTNPVTGKPDPLPQLPQQLRSALVAQLRLPPAAAGPVSPACEAAINDPNRTMLGTPQLRAFENAVSRSTATWKVIMNEVPIQAIYWDPYDRWEGYAADRRAVLTYLSAHVKNLVFLTTDFHANMVNTVKLSSFGEAGPSLDTGFYDFVTGPVALKTFAVDTDLKTGVPGAWEFVRALFKAPPPLGLGMYCAALNTYSFAQVTATSKALTVALKDANGNPVQETPEGPPCAPLTIPRK